MEENQRLALASGAPAPKVERPYWEYIRERFQWATRGPWALVEKFSGIAGLAVGAWIF